MDTTKKVSPLSQWSQEHMYRTTYGDFTHRGANHSLTASQMLNENHVSNYARILNSIGGLQSSTCKIQVNEQKNKIIKDNNSVNSLPLSSNVLYLRDSIKNKTAVEKFDERVKRKAGYDGFLENVQIMKPIINNNYEEVFPKYNFTYKGTKKIHYDNLPKQHFDESTSATYKLKDPNFGSFIPQSSTLLSSKYRDFHKSTALDTEGGRKMTTFELSAGYVHQASPYAQAWPLYPVTQSRIQQMKGRFDKFTLS